MRHFQMHFLDENIWTSINISLKFVPKGQMNNILALVQIISWNWPGDKPLSEPMAVSLQTHIWVMRHQGVNTLNFQAVFSEILIHSNIIGHQYRFMLIHFIWMLSNFQLSCVINISSRFCLLLWPSFCWIITCWHQPPGHMRQHNAVQVCVLTSWWFVISMFW